MTLVSMAIYRRGVSCYELLKVIVAGNGTLARSVGDAPQQLEKKRKLCFSFCSFFFNISTGGSAVGGWVGEELGKK